MKKTLYIEPFSGIAGDMFTAAIINLLPDREILFSALRSLPIADEFSLSLEQVERNCIKANKFTVSLNHHHEDDGHDHHHHHGRTFPEIADIINSAPGITDNAKNTAIRIFTRLAEAEAAVHGMDIKYVHFHEVGAVDAIVEITAAAVALDIIGPEKIISIPPAQGKGFIKSAHGVLPIPAPATAEILKGLPVEYTDIGTELTTPTGAAILATIVDEWGTCHAGRILCSGYGAGTKIIQERPNILRLTLLEDCHAHENDSVTVIETNIDDMSGEHLSFIGPKLLESGALDYAIIPVIMKKGRPGFIIQVICRHEDAEKLSGFLLRNTSSIGVRFHRAERVILRRETETVDTELGPVRIKLAYDENGKLLRIKPEQDDVSRIAGSHGLSYPEALDAITRCIRNSMPS